MAETKNILGTNLVDLNGLSVFWDKAKTIIDNKISAIPDSSITFNQGVTSGKDNSKFGPIEMAISAIHSANRLAFSKPAGITIEYSRDGGVTWDLYENGNPNYNESSKIALCNGNGISYFIGCRNAENTNDDKLRITLNAINMQVYTKARKILLNVSTNNSKNCSVKLETSTIGTPDNFVDRGTFGLNGWSGWNTIDTTFGTFGGGTTQTSNNGTIRLTFSHELNTNGVGYFAVSDIALYGDTAWTTPSNMAKHGHLYSWNNYQDMYIPADLLVDSNKNTTRNIGTSQNPWNNIYSKQIYIKGAYSSSAKITADNEYNMFVQVNSVIPLVIDCKDTSNLAVRPGTSYSNSVDLGRSDVKWRNIYANKFVGSLEGNADTATTASQVNNSLNIYTSTGYGCRGTTDVTFNGASSRTLTINTGTTIYGVYDGNKINITSTSSEYLPISSCNLINSGGPASNTIDAYTNVFIKFTNGITKTDKNNPSIYLVINVNGGTGGNTLFNITNPLDFLGENISEGTVLQFITLHSGNIGQRISVLYVGHHANNPLLVNSITANDVIHTPTNGSINLGYIGPKAISTSTDFSTNAYVPNKYHQINYAGTTYENKTIKLASPTNAAVVNEYLFEIVVPSVGVFVNFTDENGSSLNIKWADKIRPDWEPDCTYQVSIVNNLGTFLKFK